MRFVKYILVFTIVFASCKSNKITLNENAVAKKMSTKRVVKKHVATNFEKQTIDAKFNVGYNDGKTNQSISVQLKIQKDEVIWLKGTKIISLFKAKITPEKVSFYTGIGRKYFEGDFSMLEKILGAEVNFNQLQNMFLGQAMLDLKIVKPTLEIIDNAYLLAPEVQASLFNAFFTVNPGHFKLEKQAIISNKKSQSLEIKYPSYKLVDGVIFPREIKIEAKENQKLTTINFLLKSLEFNTELNTSFKIPSSYKPIIL